LAQTKTSRSNARSASSNHLGKDTLLYFDHGGENPTIAVVEETVSHRGGTRMALSVPLESLFLFSGDGQRVRPA